jgi:hypothetical protein
MVVRGAWERSRCSLAVDLRALGEHECARELHSDTLVRRQRVLGKDHPDTLLSANNLANNLSALGQMNRPGTYMRTP